MVKHNLNCKCECCTSGIESTLTRIQNRINVEKKIIVVPVLPDEYDDVVFAYTIGMHRLHNQPELIIALKHADAMSVGTLLQKIANKFIDNPDDAKNKIVENAFQQANKQFPVAILKINEDKTRPMCNFAVQFYENNVFPVQQILIPDSEGKFPWDENPSAEFFASQPLCAPPPDEENNI